MNDLILSIVCAHNKWYFASIFISMLCGWLQRCKDLIKISNHWKNSTICQSREELVESMERRPSAWESLGFLCFPSHCTTLGGVVAPSCLHLSILWRHNQPSQQSTLGIRVHITNVSRETPFVCALRPPALPQDSDPLPIVRFWRRHKQPHQTPVNAGQCPNQQPRCVYQCLSLGVSVLFSSILPLPGLARKWSFYSFSFHSIFLTSHFALSILFRISLSRKFGGSVWYQPALC